MGGLAAIHLAADLTLGVLDGDPSLSTLNENDAHSDGQHHYQDKDRKQHVHVAGLDELVRAQESAGDTDHDTGEDDERNAVANTLCGDLLAEPHDKDGTGRQGGDSHQTEFPAGIHDDGSAFRACHAFEHGGDAKALDKGYRDSEISRVLCDLTSARLSFFLGHALDLGAHHLQELQDDGGGDVGHDTKGEHGDVAQAAAGEHIEQCEDGTLHTGEKVRQRACINARHRHMDPHPVHAQDEDRPCQLFTQLRHLRHFVRAVRHVLFLVSSGFFVSEEFLHFAAGGKDLGLGGSGEAEGFDADGAGHFAFAKDLDESAVDQTASVDVFEGDFLLVGEGGQEAIEVNDFVSHLEQSVLEATLGQTALQGHLAAFETGTDTAAGTGVLALVALAGGAAEAGAGATADALAALTFFGERIQIVKSHYATTSTR